MVGVQHDALQLLMHDRYSLSSAAFSAALFAAADTTASLLPPAGATGP
jgi:hypothetical protein